MRISRLAGRAASALIAVSVLATLSMQAQAAPRAFCEGYVNKALSDAAIGRQCGYSGPRWGIDPAGHMTWCLGAKIDSVERELRVRDSEASKCNSCQIYVDSAISAQRENVKLGCGFSGPRWTLDTRGHMSWCMSNTDRGQVTQEHVLRKNQLQSCRTASNAGQGSVIARIIKRRNAQ